MQAEWDADAQAWYFYTEAKQGAEVARTEELIEGLHVDFDAKDRVVGIELLVISMEHVMARELDSARANETLWRRSRDHFRSAWLKQRRKVVKLEEDLQRLSLGNVSLAEFQDLKGEMRELRAENTKRGHKIADMATKLAERGEKISRLEQQVRVGQSIVGNLRATIRMADGLEGE